MSVRHLIERYAVQTRVHIRVKDVRDYMVSGQMAVKDRIEFIGVEMDTGVIRGFIHQYKVEPLPGSALMPGFVADIHYDRNQSIDWQRLVCAKELLHLLDPDAYKISTPAHVREQVERIALPPGLLNAQTDGMRIWGDRLADLQAVALLFPMEARNVLRGAKDKVTPENVARIVRLPEKYVRWVLSDAWDELYPNILTLA